MLKAIEDKIENIKGSKETWITNNYGYYTKVFKELLAHILYVYILLDVIFKQNKMYIGEIDNIYDDDYIIKKEDFVDDGQFENKTFKDFYDLLKLINTDIYRYQMRQIRVKIC